MKLYAIKDKESGLYVSRRNPKRLVEFGPDIELYSTRASAMRRVEERLGHDIDTTVLQNELAWDLLEKVYEKDRWHINCSLSELEDALAQFKNLRVASICLDEAD